MTLRWELSSSFSSLGANSICRAILKPRCKISWASCYSELPALGIFPLAQPQLEKFVPKPEPTAPAPYVIDTSFDYRLKKNWSTSDRYKPKNSRDVYNYTQTQRRLAQHAVPATSLSDLSQKVSIYSASLVSQRTLLTPSYTKVVQQLASGTRSVNSDYIEINHDALEGWGLFSHKPLY
jgi:hypothetical protein